MSRNNDSLPMLPPWLSESEVTESGYESPVQNLPQDDLIDEAPKRRRFMGRGGGDEKKEKRGRRRKSEDPAPSEASSPAEQSGRRGPEQSAEPQARQSGWGADAGNPPIGGHPQAGPADRSNARPGPSASTPPDAGPHQSWPDHERPNPGAAQFPATGNAAPPFQQPGHPGQSQGSAGSTTQASTASGSALPARTPAPPSTGFTPLGTNRRQLPDLPPPPPLPDPPARPTEAPPRLTTPAQRPAGEAPRPVTGPSDASHPADDQAQATGPADSTAHPRTDPAATSRPATDPAQATGSADANRPDPNQTIRPAADAADSGRPLTDSAQAGHPTAVDATRAPTADGAADASPLAGPDVTQVAGGRSQPGPADSSQVPPRLTTPADARPTPAADSTPSPEVSPTPPNTGAETARQGGAGSRGGAASPAATDPQLAAGAWAMPADAAAEASSGTAAGPIDTAHPESTPVDSASSASAPTPRNTTDPGASTGTRAPHDPAPAAQPRATGGRHSLAEPEHHGDPGADSAAIGAPESDSADGRMPNRRRRPDPSDGAAGGPAPAQATPADGEPRSESADPVATGTGQVPADGMGTTGENRHPLHPPGHAPQQGGGTDQSATRSAETSMPSEAPQAGATGYAAAADSSAGFAARTTDAAAQAHSPTARGPHAVSPATQGWGAEPDSRSAYATGESQVSPYSSGPTGPVPPGPQSPYATQAPAQPGAQYNSVPGDPSPGAGTPAPDGRTEVYHHDDPRLQAGHNQAPGSDPGQGPQSTYGSGEFAQPQAPQHPSPHQPPDGTWAQPGDTATPWNQAPQQPVSSPQLPIQRPDGTWAQPNGYQPDGAPPQQPHPDGGQQYQQSQAPVQRPGGTWAQPDGTAAPWNQPPQQPFHGGAQQYQHPHGQWGAHPPQHGFQPPSLDNVPVKRAKKAPGSGWRKAVHHVSGGAINPGMSAEERRLQELVARIRQPVRGDYRIAVLSLKGGVGKTTTTTGLGSIFASIRGDRVIAVDANPDFGTLSQRVSLQTRSTVRDLLLDPAIERYSDVRRHTSQSSSRLEVLASERDPAASESFNDEEYRAVARILQRFYNIILTDCGTGLMHSAMSGVLDLAHSLVLISSAAIDGARSAAATLDWLSLHGHDHLVRNAVVVINLPREGSPNVGVQQLREYFLSRCRAVHIIPFDEHLSEGAEIDLHRLHKSTKRAYVELAATVADEFGVEHRRYG
ncbi:MinD/ParA family ATP-binding protein [Nocardia rhizosphaerae]|uniref:AAA family ATPase n=1 Tax=Nocardia rhizosphaerae TaxID=1691571 RepID=A0ABV8L270_9NOCA